MRKLRVLHMSSSGKICGIATYATNLIKHFDDECVHDFFPIIDKMVLVDYSKSKIIDFFDSFIEKAKDYDVIHIQNEFGLFNGPFGLDFSMKVFYRMLSKLKKLNKKVFITYHSEPSFLKSLGILNFEHRGCAKYWKKLAKLHTKKNNITAIVHTKSTESIFKDTNFENVIIIRHGVLERSLPKNFKVKQKEDPIILGMFGFVSSYKGHEFALSIMDLLPSNFKLYIIGGRHPASEGEEIGKILIKANELGLTNRVLITGWTTPEDADIHQSHCDICLVPYQTTEISASGAITWNLPSGKPVIASNIRSFREINNACPSGDPMFLCHHTERAEWVWAIKRVLNEPKLKHSLIDNARKYCDDFSWTNTCKQHIRYYKK